MYAMIAYQECSAITDEMIYKIETVFLPRMKSAGTLDVQNIQISGNSATNVSIWSDQAAADRAMEAVSSACSHRNRPA